MRTVPLIDLSGFLVAIIIIIFNIPIAWYIEGKVINGAKEEGKLNKEEYRPLVAYANYYNQLRVISYSLIGSCLNITYLVYVYGFSIVGILPLIIYISATILPAGIYFWKINPNDSYYSISENISFYEINRLEFIQNCTLSNLRLSTVVKIFCVFVYSIPIFVLGFRINLL